MDNVLRDIVEDLLVKSEHSSNTEGLISILKKTEYTPYDLISLNEYINDIDDATDDIIDMLNIIEQDILYSIGTLAFARELNKVLPLFKKKCDIKIINKIIYFLEHEEEDEYHIDLSVKFVNIIPKIKDVALQKICLLTIRKINNLLILS